MTLDLVPAPMRFGLDGEGAGTRLRAAVLDGAVEAVLAGVRTGSATSVRFVNAYSIALGATDRDYGAVLNGRGVNFPDGAPVGLLVRRKAARAGIVGGQIRGPSFFAAALEAGRGSNIRHYLLGGTEHSLEALVTAIEARSPGAVIAGVWAPPFGPFDDALLSDVSDRIRVARPDLIWVGLGTPKQDFVVAALVERLGVTALGVGAAFDFHSGRLREAPAFFRRAGLEWLHRLVSEPRRLWRRYVFGNGRFLLEVMRSEFDHRRA